MMRSNKYERRALDYLRLAARADVRDRAMFLAVAQGCEGLARRSAHLEATSRRDARFHSPGSFIAPRRNH
jgi:hypothetical protein